jgi:hypothetical protein
MRTAVSDQAIEIIVGFFLILLITSAVVFLIARKDRRRAALWRASFSETRQNDLLDLVEHGLLDRPSPRLRRNSTIAPTSTSLG